MANKNVIKTAPANNLNIIGAGTSIKGEINSDGDIRIDGKLEGNITTSGKIFIGETGEITGNIDCQRADISGKVKGKIIVKELLSLKETSETNGDIITAKLSVEPDAKFNGTCKMGSIGSHVKFGTAEEE